MRRLLFISLICVTAHPAWPCQPRPVPHATLALLTSPGSILPGNGALIVLRRQVEGSRGDDDDIADEHWIVKDGDGHEVAITTEDLGSGLERWRPTTIANRDLVIFDQTGKQIAKVQQIVGKAVGPSAPKAKRVRSTLARTRPVPMDAVPGGKTSLELDQDPPADAIALTIAITGSGGFAHSSYQPTAKQRTFEWATFTRKACAGGGIEPLLIGEHIAITWVDKLGRRSPQTALTVGQLPKR